MRIAVSDAGISYTYPLRLRNRTDKPLTAAIEADLERTLKSFRADPATSSVELATGEEKAVPIRLSISQEQVKKLTLGYGESACPKVSVDGLS